MEVTYESNLISLLCGSTMSSFVFYLFYCNLKEKDHIRRKVNSKKVIYLSNQYYYLSNQYYYYFDLPKIRVGVLVQQKIKLSSP